MWMKIFIKKRGDTGAEPRFSDKRKKRKIWQAELKGLMDAKIWLCENIKETSQRKFDNEFEIKRIIEKVHNSIGNNNDSNNP